MLTIQEMEAGASVPNLDLVINRIMICIAFHGMKVDVQCPE